MRFRWMVGAAVALAVVASLRGETPLGTGFTFQGQLKEAGVPVDGTADFQFTLWDAAGNGNPPTGGIQVGGVQAINALPVSAGLFTVTLNDGGEFGVDALSGSGRWLQVAVRSPAGGGSFSTLAPRQPLTAAPYALFALSVPGGVSDGHSLDAADGSPVDALFVNDTGRVGIGTTAPDNTLHVMKGSAGAVTAHANAPLVVENSTHAYISLLTPDASERGLLFGSPTAGAPAGGIIYNSAATPEGLQFRTGGNVTRMVLDSTGNLGIGINSSLTAKLDVRTTGTTSVFGQTSAATGTTFAGYFQSDSTTGRGVYGHATAATGTTFGVFGHTHSPDGRGVYGLAALSTGTSTGVYGWSLGDTGRGVFGEATNANGVTTGVWGQSVSPDGRGVYGSAIAATGYAGYFSGGRNYFEGNVGIGTTNPAAKLHVNGGSDVTPAGGGFAVFGTTNSTNIAIDNNEIMARNNGAVATLTLNANGGDVVCGGAIDIGYELVSHSVTCNPGAVVDVSCPAGKQLLVGGCRRGCAGVGFNQAYPLGTTGWRCQWLECGCASDTLTAYATCANVK